MLIYFKIRVKLTLGFYSMYIIKHMQETYVLHLKGEDKNEYRFEYFFLPIRPVDCLAHLTVETTALPSTTEMTSHSKLSDSPAMLLLLLLSRFSRGPALCDPIDGSPTGSPVPGILQARTLEWVAISFSNA